MKYQYSWTPVAVNSVFFLVLVTWCCFLSPISLFSPPFAEDLIRLLSDLAVLIWSSTWAHALTGSWLRCSGGFTLRSLQPRLRGSPSRHWLHKQTSVPLRYKDTSCSTRQTRLAPSKTLQRSSSEDLETIHTFEWCKLSNRRVINCGWIILWSLHSLDKDSSHIRVIKSNLWKMCVCLCYCYCYGWLIVFAFVLRDVLYLQKWPVNYTSPEICFCDFEKVQNVVCVCSLQPCRNWNRGYCFKRDNLPKM